VAVLMKVVACCELYRTTTFTFSIPHKKWACFS